MVNDNIKNNVIKDKNRIRSHSIKINILFYATTLIELRVITNNYDFVEIRYGL